MERAVGSWGPDLRGPDDREQLRSARTGEGRGGAPTWAGNGRVGTPVLASAGPRPGKIGLELGFQGRKGRGAKAQGGSRCF